MDLMEMVDQERQRRGLSVIQLAREVSRYREIDRTSMQRYIHKDYPPPPEMCWVFLQWLGQPDQEMLIKVLRHYGYIPAEGEPGIELSVQRQLQVVREELQKIEQYSTGKWIGILEESLPAGGMAWLDSESVQQMILPKELISDAEKIIAVPIKGDSLEGRGIEDGDLVLVALGQDPRPGQIVVARIGDEVTIKQFFPGDKEVELRPANPRYNSITAKPGDVSIVGVVIMAIKRL